MVRMDRLIMALAFKIRGIYTTALTSFLLEKGMAIASPSAETAERFKKVKGAVFREPADVEIRDLEARQGIFIQGSGDACKRVAGLIKESFLDAVFRGDRWTEAFGIEIEFPYLVKSALDEQRNKIIPTVFNHHRLRIIASEVVDLIEKKELSNHPERRRAVSENLEKRLVWDGYTPGKEIGLSHVKVDGQVLSLSEGEVIEADFKKRKLTLRRSKFKGRSTYDGLDVPKQEGDYAITEVREGEWFYRHTYLRQNGEIIGWYYNINTPVEFYPEEIRYVDLEIDVVVRPGCIAQVKDEDIMEDRVRMGFLSDRLKEAALRATQHLLSQPLPHEIPPYRPFSHGKE
jgi:hypothetical protein